MMCTEYFHHPHIFMFESSFRVEQDSPTIQWRQLERKREKYQLDDAEVEHLGVSENGVYYWRYNMGTKC